MEPEEDQYDPNGRLEERCLGLRHRLEGERRQPSTENNGKLHSKKKKKKKSPF